MASTEELIKFMDKVDKEFATMSNSKECDNFITKEKEIGKGKFGTVYKGKYKGENVAIKISDINYETFVQESDNIKHEAFISKYLITRDSDSPITPIREVFLCNDGDSWVRSYIVMELSRGYDLRELLIRRIRDSWYNQAFIERGNKFNINLNLTILLVLGLRSFHEQQVYHQDIKIDNILIDLSDSSNTIKFIDFGLSCMYLDDTSLPNEIKERYKELSCTFDNKLRGSPSYIHPYAWVMHSKIKEGEKITSQERKDISFLRDWYALGCVLYMLWRGTGMFVKAKTTKDLNDMIKDYAYNLSDNYDNIDIRMEQLGWRPNVTKYNQKYTPSYAQVMNIINTLTSFSPDCTRINPDEIIRTLERLLRSQN